MRLDRSAIFLSLHPRFARLIYSGVKRAELRRVGPARTVRVAYIYETAPVGRVTGWIRFGKIESGTANRLWEKYRHELSISRGEFERYLTGCSRPTVLPIESHRRFRRQLPLAGVHGPSRPPQSYCYFDSGLPLRR